MLAKRIVHNIIIVEFNQRISIMQNEITKNVIMAIINLIRTKFAKIDISQLSRQEQLSLSSIPSIKILEEPKTTSLSFALFSTTRIEII